MLLTPQQESPVASLLISPTIHVFPWIAVSIPFSDPQSIIRNLVLISPLLDLSRLCVLPYECRVNEQVSEWDSERAESSLRRSP